MNFLGPPSEVLWGRDAELGQLNAALTAASAGITQFVALKGLPGAGKTALLRWTQQRNGFVLYAKADQQETCTPLFLLNKLFDSWLATFDEARANAWRVRLRQDLGADAPRSIYVFPALGQFLDIAAAPPSAALIDDRITDVVVGLFNMLLKYQQPLVLLLDDVQWADESTFAALRGLAQVHLRTKLTVVLAFRPYAAVQNSLASIARLAAAWTDIAVSPLAPEAIEEMVKVALPHAALAQVHELSQHLLASTKGNAFAITAMLHDVDPATATLKAYDVLQSDAPLTSVWLSKLHELPAPTRLVLAASSCMGRLIFADFLRGLLHDSCDVSAALQLARTATLVVHESGTWRFAHDSIHEAIYGALSSEEREDWHTQIAALLLRQNHPHAYAIARHVNAGGAIALAQLGWQVCAQANRVAAQQARAVSACARSAEYLEHVCRIEHEAAGVTPAYLADLAEQATCAGLGGDVRRCQQLFDVALAQTHDSLARAKLYASLAEVLALNDQLHEAVALMREGLRSVGTRVSAKPSAFAVVAQFFKARRALRGRSAYDVAALARIEDEQVLTELRLLCSGLVAAYLTSPTLLAWSCLRLAELTFSFGRSPYSGLSHVGYAVNVLLLRRDPLGACEFARVGGEIAQQDADIRYGTLANFFELMMVAHWYMPLTELVARTLTARERLRAVGDVNAVCYYSNDLYIRWFFGNATLAALHEDAEICRRQAAIYPPTYATTTTLIVCEALAFLHQRLERETASRLQQRIADLLKNRVDTEGYEHAFADSYWLMICAYLSGDYNAACALGQQALSVMIVRPGMFIQAAHLFFYGLSLAQGTVLAKTALNRFLLQARLRTCRRKLRRWSQGNPENFLAMSLLLDGEVALLRHRPEMAVVYFEQAIEMARAQQSTLLQGIACERAAYVYRLRHGSREAVGYLRQAMTHYRAWEAWAKVASLEAEHPDSASEGWAENNAENAAPVAPKTEPAWRAIYERLAEREHQQLGMQIAGGMAHQLRNALSPALVLRHVLHKAEETPAARAAHAAKVVAA